ncbi:hypothetical protein sos41_01450 [Alphaproteobacteria bacterium SO-S41]|nr:hypothetical protein sos41_01450 [Alphaproteobacteria bacterium SO-S41]
MIRIAAALAAFLIAVPPAVAETSWGSDDTASAPAAAADTAYSPVPWLHDLAQIKRILAEQAPNLEWSIRERGLDLVQLASDADADLRNAGSDEGARAVLRDFISRFGDGHISLMFPDEKADTALPWGTASICKGLGYEEEEQPDGLPFDKVGGRSIETPDSAVFPISVLDLPGGKLGVLRIPSFYEWGYYQYCPQAVAAVGLPEDGECGTECGAAIAQKAADLLTEAVGRQIGRLKDEDVTALAVDITQNGGGSLWLDPVARMLTAVKLKAPHLAFTRTAPWREALQANLGLIETDLASGAITPEERTALETARATTTSALAEAMQSCDRSGVWQGKTPTCSLVAPAMLYATGIFDYAAPGQYAHLNSAAALFFSSLYAYQEGLWQGPLYVVLDEGSASAAEHFAALLKDNGAAVLIGEPSYGAGCGWMASGDTPVTLDESRAELHVPDCVWTRDNGANELAGIEPDILVPWRYYDNPLQKVRRLATMLQTLDFKAWPAAGVRPAIGKVP